MRSPSRHTRRGGLALLAAGLTAAALLISSCGGATNEAPPAASAPAKATVAPSAAAAATSAPAANGAKEVALVTAVRPNLVNVVDALQKGDASAAKKALKAYDSAWNGIEVYVSYRCADCYTQLESVLQAKVENLLDAMPPSTAEALPVAQQLLAKYDETIKIVQTGPAISPLFDDVAALRILRAATIRDATPALKAGDVATTKSLITTFMDKWDGVEDLVKNRNTDTYSEIEAAMSKLNSALQKSSPSAAELTPLLATLSDRFNYGISLVNAAARGADMSKKTFTTQDVQAAADLVSINNELKASLIAWQGGKFEDAGTRAKNANGTLFTKVEAPLKAKNNADAPCHKAIGTYADLAGKAGDAATVASAQKAAFEAVLVAQQWVVGQFWTDPKLKEAISALVK